MPYPTAQASQYDPRALAGALCRYALSVKTALPPGLSSQAAGLIVCLLTLGCQSAGGSEGPHGSLRTAQLILRFTPEISSPDDQAYLRELSRAAGVELVYLRPMSGNAHVFASAAPLSSDQLRKILDRLTARQDIMLAEEDLRLRQRME
jgi:hypothetical protein